MLARLRQPAIGSPLAVVYPVPVWVTVIGSAPLARVARTPLTYSWRVSRVAGAVADQMCLVASTSLQPVSWTPPLITGNCPGWAFHQIEPAEPVEESAAVRTSGLLSR